MRALVRMLGAALAATALAVVPTTSAGGAAPSPATYLALGDSVAAGVGAPTGQGYVPLLADALRDARHCGKGAAVGCGLELQNLSVGGATTTTLISGQLPEAVALLEAHHANATPVDDVRLITLTIGGNDVFTPVLAACGGGFTASCATTVQSRFGLVAQNLTQILATLRAAAGPDTTIAVMTYYNSLQTCVASAFAPLAELLLDGSQNPPVPSFNGLLAQVAMNAGAVVVPTKSFIGPEDLVGGNDCLHPDASGHAEIAGAFAAALTDLVVGPPGRR